MTAFLGQIETAKRLIAKSGAQCVWTKPAPEDADAKPWRDVREGAATNFDVRIGFFSAKDLGFGSTFALANMAATEVPQSTKMGLMSGGLPFEPELADTVTLNGEIVDVTKIDTLAPDGVPILYFLWIA